MTLHTQDFLGTALPYPNVVHWPGGPAQLFMQRFPARFSLGADDIAQLLPDEKLRLTRSARQSKAHLGLAARLQLRRMLSDILACAPSDIILTNNPDGRPQLHPDHGIAALSLDFSISYTPQGFAICIAKDRRVGVDMQRFNTRQEDNFETLFGGYQQRRHSTTLRPQELWTRMEAYGKMQGEGLAHGLHRLYRIALKPQTADIGCHFIDFRYGSGISLSLCLSGAAAGPVCILS